MEEKEADRRLGTPVPPPPEAAMTTKGFIKIPSYQEVFDSPSSSSTSYNPPSFSEAFSFIKSSELYSPPPPPPLPPQPPTPDVLATPDSAGLLSSAHLPAQPPSSSSSFEAASSSGQNRNAILVSHRQKGNPLLKHIRNVRWVFADVVCDYLLGQSTCALYISLRYHLLHPDYLYYRIRELQKNFRLRIVLCHVDVEDVVKPLHEVTRTAMLHDCTLLCGWSLEECGRYLETIKIYENKPSDSIREQMDTDYLSRLTHALTSIRHVNKTDVITLGSAFGSLSRIMDASMEELARCPGIGERKVKRLYDTFHEPFRRVSSRFTVPITQTLSEKEDAVEPSHADVVADENKQPDTTKTQSNSGATVRSVLAAAFAKHAEKLHRTGRSMKAVESGEGCSSQVPEDPCNDQ